MKQYTVMYKEYASQIEKPIVVIASNKADAYDKAVYDELNGCVYSAWVEGVTHNNGNYQRFNTYEGKRF